MKRSWQVALMAVVLSLALTAGMSVLFHQTLRADFLATGLVCAVVVNRVIGGITRRHSAALREANETLEARVAERTQALEQELRTRETLQQQLAVTDRLATAGSLAAGVSHEIRNPLSAILGNLEAAQELARGDPDPVELRACLDDALAAAHQVRDVAEDLSTLARPDQVARSDTSSLQAVIDTAGRLAAHELRTRADVTVDLDPELPPVHGAPPRLVQVFLNLLINAARASRDDARNDIVLRGRAVGGQVRVTVQDRGLGIDPEVLDQIFEPFFTTRADAGGTGIGLFICRQIVREAGGRLSVTSTQGVGTTFEVWLPQADAASTARGGPADDAVDGPLEAR